jgi:hypothetical protein
MSWLIPAMRARGGRAKWQVLRPTSGRSWRQSPSINHRLNEQALHKACFIVETNERESEVLSDQELVTTYKEQGGVERGFRGSRKIRCCWPPRSQSRNRSGLSL